MQLLVQSVSASIFSLCVKFGFDEKFFGAERYQTANQNTQFGVGASVRYHVVPATWGWLPKHTSVSQTTSLTA